MKYNFLSKTLLYASFFLLANIASSCDDDIQIGEYNNSAYKVSEKTFVSLVNNQDPRPMRVKEVYSTEDAKAELTIKLTKPAIQDIAGKLVVDAKFVEEYNTANGTSFEVFPTDLISFENGSEAIITKGSAKSAVISFALKNAAGDAKLVEGQSYLLPISFVANKAAGNDLQMTNSYYMYVVKARGEKPNTAKASGIVTNMFFEVNDTNILNAMGWTLKNSGKPMADIVTIFAANINYDEASGRVLVRMNENVSGVLNNCDKYVRPLQARGIKVNLAILGNWDRSGVANLAPETAKAFAQELKTIIDGYGLDGVEFDDEYSSYGQGGPTPGFVSPSSDAYARLCYEVKKAMPDKYCSVYHYGYAGFGNQIEGMNPGDFVDYTYEAFYGGINESIWRYYLGMTKKQLAPYSRKIYSGLYFYNSDMQKVRDEYGVNMLYNYQTRNMNDYRRTFSDMTKILYDEEVVYEGPIYPKDY